MLAAISIRLNTSSPDYRHRSHPLGYIVTSFFGFWPQRRRPQNETNRICNNTAAKWQPIFGVENLAPCMCMAKGKKMTKVSIALGGIEFKSQPLPKNVWYLLCKLFIIRPLACGWRTEQNLKEQQLNGACHVYLHNKRQTFRRSIGHKVPSAVLCGLRQTWPSFIFNLVFLTTAIRTQVSNVCRFTKK